MVVVTAVGAPVKEALALAGLSDDAVLSLELNGDLLLVMKLAKFWKAQPVDLWLEWLISIGDTAEIPKVDWLVAICPHSPTHLEKKSQAVCD